MNYIFSPFPLTSLLLKIDHLHQVRKLTNLKSSLRTGFLPCRLFLFTLRYFLYYNKINLYYIFPTFEKN